MRKAEDGRSGSAIMLKFNLRFFIVPLGAAAALIALSAQGATQSATSQPARETASLSAAAATVDCSRISPAEVCVIPN